MKEFVLLRHAKSSWADENSADFDRKLNKRGRQAAPLMASWLVGAGWQPDLVLCSAARRTQETLALMTPPLTPATVVVERSLYLASSGKLLARLRSVDGKVERAMMVGHNPGLELLAREFDRGIGDASARLKQKFPTAALAWFRSAASSWATLGDAELVAFMTPADLTGLDED